MIQHLSIPVKPLTANRWQGHLPAASLALSALLERATRGGRQFTDPERAVFMACEFWVAVQTRTLVNHPGLYGADCLRYLTIVYSAMGAHHVARALITGVSELGDTTSPLARLKCLTALQERTARTQDPVDQLIAGLADNLDLSAVPCPARVPDAGLELSAQRA